MKDYYKILKVERNSSSEKIKKAYREGALFWHPDKNKNVQASEKFILINEAYNILIDANKRILYDKLYDEYFIKNIDVEVNENTKKDYKTYEQWVADERSKSNINLFDSFDSLLTNSFSFLDKYLWFIFLFIIVCVILVMSAN